MLAKSLIVLCIATYYVADAQLSWANPSGGTGTLNVDEDQATSTTIGTAYTVTGGTGAVTYSVEQGMPPFEVDSGTGALSISTALDAEATASYTVKIKAVDSTVGTALSSTATITVTVGDVNEADPVFAPSSYSPCIVDASTSGTSLITVTASDADVSNTITYAFTADGNPSSAFSIPTSSSGLIQAATTLSKATTPSYILKVTAADSGSSVRTATVTFTVTVADSCNSAMAATVSMMLLLVALFGTLF